MWFSCSPWVNSVADTGAIDSCDIAAISVGSSTSSFTGTGVWVPVRCPPFMHWEKSGIVHFLTSFSIVCFSGFNICLVLISTVDSLVEIIRQLVYDKQGRNLDKHKSAPSLKCKRQMLSWFLNQSSPATCFDLTFHRAQCWNKAKSDITTNNITSISIVTPWLHPKAQTLEEHLW